MRNQIFAMMLIASALLMSAPSQAVVIINAVEVGPDVVFSYSGTIDLDGLGTRSENGNANDFTLFGAGVGAVLFGHGNAMDSWVSFSYQFPAFGTSGNTSTSDAGDGLSVYGNAFGIYTGYISNNFLSGSATYSGTFASLGLNVGSYTATLPMDTLTLNIGVSVPEPGTLGLLGAGLLGLFMRRKRVA